MKKFFAIALVAASFTACSDNAHTNESTADSVEVAPPAPAETAPADSTMAPATTDSTVVK